MIAVTRSWDKRIQKKDILVSINKHKIDDWMDFTFYNDLKINRKIMIVSKRQAKTFVLKAREQLNIDLAEPIWRQCENDCEYCFIKGLPQGSRKSLFFRDDDFRLSFLHGNFISLTNINMDDYRKIFNLNLSPLYVSVQSTNPDLRSRIFKNDKAAGIIEQLKYLIKNNIVVHSQIVIIPGINDSAELSNTIDDLISLYPGLASIGLVPIGRTRKNQFLNPVTKKLARNIADLSLEINQKNRKKYKRGIVYAADEIFLTAHRDIPPTAYYDDMPQFENGIGMIRNFLNAISFWRSNRRFNKEILILTGRLAYPFIKQMKKRMIELGIMRYKDIIIRSVENTFFGPTVTVAGLIGGQDFNHAVKNERRNYDLVILPPYCMNSKHQMIDNQPPPKNAVVAPQDFKEFIPWLQSL